MSPSRAKINGRTLWESAVDRSSFRESRSGVNITWQGDDAGKVYLFGGPVDEATIPLDIGGKTYVDFQEVVLPIEKGGEATTVKRTLIIERF